MNENGPSDAAIYARVSTSDQDVSRQLDEAHEHLECLGMYWETTPPRFSPELS